MATVRQKSLYSISNCVVVSSPQLCDTQDEVAQTLAGAGINGLGMFGGFHSLLMVLVPSLLCYLPVYVLGGQAVTEIPRMLLPVLSEGMVTDKELQSLTVGCGRISICAPPNPCSLGGFHLRVV